MVTKADCDSTGNVVRLVVDTLADTLPSAPDHQVRALFDGANIAYESWAAAINTPAAGYEGETTVVVDLLEAEAERCFRVMEAAATELRRRPITRDTRTTDIADRVRILAAWFAATGDDTFYPGIVEAVSAAAPQRNRATELQ